MTISTDKDRVRLLIGDTDATQPLLYDDEVENFLAARSVLDSSGGTLSVNVTAAAADCAGAIAARYARQFNFSEDGQSFQLAQRVGQYQALERTLRNRAGGISIPLRTAGTAST